MKNVKNVGILLFFIAIHVALSQAPLYAHEQESLEEAVIESVQSDVLETNVNESSSITAEVSSPTSSQEEIQIVTADSTECIEVSTTSVSDPEIKIDLAIEHEAIDTSCVSKEEATTSEKTENTFCEVKQTHDGYLMPCVPETPCCPPDSCVIPQSGCQPIFPAPPCDPYCRAPLFCEPCCYVPCDCGCFFLGVGVLFARPGMDGTHFAQNFTTTITTVGGPVKDVENGSDPFDPGTEDNDSQDGWAPGITVNLGFCPCDSNWSVLFIGNYLHSKSETKSDMTPVLSSSFLNYTTPLWNTPLMGNAAGSTKGTWVVDFLTLDLLSYGYFIPWKCIALMPNFGLRGVWIRQELTASYDNVLFFTSGGTLTTPHTESKARFRYGAIGFKAGTDFQVPIVSCLSFIGGVGGSLLYGEVKSLNVADGAQVEDVGVLTFVKNSQEDLKWRVRANLESEFGFLFSPCWRCWRMSLAATYFFSLWFDQSEIGNLFFSAPPLISDATEDTYPIFERRPANLQIQGVSLSLNVFF